MERDRIEAPDEYCKVILKRIFKELKEVHGFDLSGTVWRKVASCELCRIRNIVFRNMLGIPRLRGKILLSGKRFCSTELVSWSKIIHSLVSVRNST